MSGGRPKNNEGEEKKSHSRSSVDSLPPIRSASAKESLTSSPISTPSSPLTPPSPPAQSKPPGLPNRSRAGRIYIQPSLAALAQGRPDKVVLASNGQEPLTVLANEKPSFPDNIVRHKTLSNNQATHLVRHGLEGRNPYVQLVAPMEGLPVICISAFGATKNAFDQIIKYNNKQFNSSLTSGDIAKHNASLPNEFVLGAALMAAKLAGPDAIVMSRVTLWAQDSMPSAGKPPTSKLKTGKGGISGGVIPVDLDTTTKEGPDGKLVALKQNPNHRPDPSEASITTVQWAKPLDQVITGLDKNPPDFLMLSSDAEIQKKGYIEFKMNCSDNDAMNQSVYRVDLRQEVRPGFENETVKPVKLNEVKSKQPSWWSESFGDFKEKAREGFHIDYKKNPEQEFFKPYEVYAEIDAFGNKLPLTGDQDLFAIPRSSLYDLGSLATNVLDTHAPDGIEHLVDDMKKVHKNILKQDFAQGKISMSEVNESIQNFYQFLDLSHSYIEALGTITPYEAYFLVQLNNQIASIKEQFKDSPEQLNHLVSQVNVDVSIGIKDLKVIDIDLNKAWYIEKPAEMSARVEANLAKGFHVSPDILELHVAYQANNPSINNKISDDNHLLDSMKEDINMLAIEHKTDWKVYAKVETDEHPPTLPGEKLPEPPFFKWAEVSQEKPVEPERIVELMINATQDKGHTCVHVTNQGATSNLDKAQVAKVLPEMNADVKASQSYAGPK